MGVRTSAIIYTRGVPKENQANFFIVAQSNYNVISPMNKYLKNYSFYNRNIVPSLPKLFSWK
jgi:hypothetical protein